MDANHPDMKQLLARLERLQREQRVGYLDPQDVWQVMQEANQLLDHAKGSPMEQTLRVILDLLDSVWRNARTQELLAGCRAALAGGDPL